MNASDRIEINPRIMLGKPVIRGTRITVELVLRKLAGGATESELLDAYPSLMLEDIRAASITSRLKQHPRSDQRNLDRSHGGP